MKPDGSVLVLSSLVELLKDEGEIFRGEPEGDCAYIYLDFIRSQASTFGVPLSEIGLEGYDIDALLQKRPDEKK